MPLKITKNLNKKRFIFISLIILGLSLCFASSQKEIIVFISIYLATLVNYYFLMKIVNEIAEIAAENKKLDKLNMLIYGTIKLMILFGSLSLGVHFIGNKIIIPLINYVILIFVLGLCFLEKEK